MSIVDVLIINDSLRRWSLEAKCCHTILENLCGKSIENQSLSFIQNQKITRFHTFGASFHIGRFSMTLAKATYKKVSSFVYDSLLIKSLCFLSFLMLNQIQWKFIMFECRIHRPQNTDKILFYLWLQPWIQVLDQR